MGFSLIASAVVISISIAMAVEIFTGDVFPTVDHINTAYEGLKGRIDTQAHTDINITSISRLQSDDAYDYTIIVQNTGSVTLPTATMTILFNGTKEPFTASTAYLYPESTATFSVNGIAGASGKRIKVVTVNAIADYLIYTP